VTAEIHDRMPVILDADAYDLWLDTGVTNVNSVSDLLKPYPADLMRCYSVSTRVNQVQNDDEECSNRIELGETQGLFSSKCFFCLAFNAAHLFR
jgi:putative SOS response-associated peptidase YedK